MLTDTDVLDVTRLLREVPRPPRPLGATEPNVLVREIGPESRLWGVRLADGATVGDLKLALAPLIGHRYCREGAEPRF